MSKDMLQRRIDATAGVRAGIVTVASEESVAPPALISIPEPVNLVLSTTVSRSAATPTALISASWDMPGSVEPTKYAVRWSTSNIFPANDSGGQDALTDSTTIDGLPTITLFYVQVAAVYRSIQGPWSAAMSITTANDSVPPSVPTSPALAFIGSGDAVITHMPSTSLNYKDTEIRIFSDASQTTLYATVYDATGRFVWTSAQNKAATGGAGDPSLYVVMRSRSWTNVFSSPVNTGLVTKSAPTAPTVTVNFDSPNCVFSIAPPTDADTLSFVSNIGVSARLVGRVGRLVYTFDQNRLDHGGTPNPVLSYSFTSIDGLGQTSAATSGTATNPVPTMPTLVSLVGLFSGFRVDVTATPPPDFLAYRYRIIQSNPTATDAIVTSIDNSYARNVDAPATYQAGIRLVDVFGQVSPEFISNPLSVDALTIEQIRADTRYRDGANSYLPVFDALKDNVTSSGGPTYASGTTHVITAERSLFDRVKTITWASTCSLNVGVYFSILKADGNYVWFSGPLTSGRILTARASESQAAANNHAVASGNQALRFDLPAQIETREVRVHFFVGGSGATVQVHEFYPRRLVQSEDIEAEAVRAINIAAQAVSVDKLLVPGTASFDAALRLIAFRVPVSLDAGSGIYQGTGTFASPSTGLKFYNQGGLGRLAGYSGGVEQASFDTDGKIKGGGGKAVLDATGFSGIADSTGEWSVGGYKLLRGNGYNFGIFNGFAGNYGGAVNVGVWNPNTQGFVAAFTAQYDSNGSGQPTSNYKLLLNAPNTEITGTTTVQGQLNTWGRAYINASPSFPGAPAISLAVGDNDTGFNWQGDGVLDMISNGQGRVLLRSEAVYTDQPSALGTGSYESRDIARFRGFAPNTMNFSIKIQRVSASPANSWESTAVVLQRSVDATNQGYISMWGENVGIGTINPAYRLELPNTANNQGQGRANAWIVYSSETRKRNIKNLESTRDRVLATKARRWRSREDDTASLGFVAEELIQTFPEVVSGDVNDPASLGVDYGRLAAVLWRMNQEQEDDIQHLRRAVRRLQNQFGGLKRGRS